jgi:hypothetical protein
LGGVGEDVVGGGGFVVKDVVWSLIKDGDHRLSRPQDIARMVSSVLALARELDAKLAAS